MEFEFFDTELMEMINTMSTQTNDTVNSSRGTYNLLEDSSWEATLSDSASSAVQNISYDANAQTVTIQFVSQERVYTYAVVNNAESQLRDEVVNVIENDRGSVGKLFNELQRSNNLQLL
jgi:putative lipoic acid-binding regulatory protein